METNIDNKLVLRDAGFRVTSGRIALLKLLKESKKPLSIQDVMKKLQGKSIDQTTIYRIVEALRKKNIIQYVNLEHGHAHFELVSPTHHHHAICENCGKIVDISKCSIKHLEEDVLNVSKFKNLTRHSLEFFGICNSCAKNK